MEHNSDKNVTRISGIDSHVKLSPSPYRESNDPPSRFGDSDVKLLPEKLFKSFKKLIFEQCGITLNEQKRLMLSVRIQKRLRSLGGLSYLEYLDYLSSQNGSKELPFLINVVTTNKTDFFREPYHFTILTTQLLPELERTQPFSNTNRLHIWSAGCSSGEEPYTLAIVLSDYFENRPGQCFQILATDISTDVLKKAIRAIYTNDVVRPIPKHFLRKYLMKGSGEWKDHWRITPNVRKTIQFGQLNFSDRQYGIEHSMHIVFCRNVIIYFSQETKASVIKKLSTQLIPRGYLFIGHSETLHHISTDFEPVERTVYRKL